MRIRKFVFLFLLTYLFIFPSTSLQKNPVDPHREEVQIKQSREKEMTVNDWLEDFNSFYDMIKTNYPYLRVKERQHGYNWLNLKKHYQQRILKAKKAIEFLDIFYDAVQALQNGHTRVFEPEWLDYYYRDSPTNFYRTKEPFRSIFTGELRKRYEYWRPVNE